MGKRPGFRREKPLSRYPELSSGPDGPDPGQ
jgi:hypothetical protein